MGFWELIVIGVVALLVLGPERLPSAIRSVHKTVRSVKQFGQQMQAELTQIYEPMNFTKSLKMPKPKDC